MLRDAHLGNFSFVSYFTIMPLPTVIIINIEASMSVVIMHSFVLMHKGRINPNMMKIPKSQTSIISRKLESEATCDHISVTLFIFLFEPKGNDFKGYSISENS